jgi:predicted methyltransferase
MTDINEWYRVHRDLCPNCGWVLKDLHPMANLYPHWTGACKEMREQEYLAEIKKAQG